MVKKGLPLFIAMAIPCCYLLWLTAIWGVGGTPDSANYLAVARGFCQDGSLQITGNRELLWWPPLYPISWGLALKLGLADFRAAQILNLVSLAAFALGCQRLCFRFLAIQFAWIAWFALVLSLAPMRIFAQALSEPGFLALSIWALYFQIRAHSESNRSCLVLAICVTAAACLWRYLGVVLIFSGAAAFFLCRSFSNKRLTLFAIWTLATATPLSAWLLRNWWISNTLTGVRPKGALGILGNTQALGIAAYDWLFNSTTLSFDPALFLSMTGTLLILGLVWAFRESLLPTLRSSLENPAFTLPWVFALSYLVLFLILSSATLTTKPNTRLLAPMASPALFGGFIFLQTLCTIKPKAIPQKWLTAFTIFILCLCAYGLFLGMHERQEGWGARNRLWQTSATMEWAATHDSAGLKMYCNMRQELYLNTMVPASGLPRTFEKFRLLAAQLSKTGGIIVWSNLPAEMRRPYNWQDVKALFPSQIPIQLEDGWILQIPKPERHPSSP